MEWSLQFPQDQPPTLSQLREAVNTPLWDSLCSSLEEGYAVVPKLEYSKCSMAPGWNVKYKKSGKSLCILYPNVDSFACLVVIGDHKSAEAELLLPFLSSYTQQLYRDAPSGNGSKWLMAEVTTEAILKDVLALIRLRAEK